METIKYIFGWVFKSIVILGTVTAVTAADDITFKGTTKINGGDFVLLKGKLTKPQADGPFPAVVLLHGCSGIQKSQDDWASRLATWGYVSLQVDSFNPRGTSDICGNSRRVPFEIRTQDAIDAKSFLCTLPFVDSNKIAIIGWSHGGSTTLSSVSISNFVGLAGKSRIDLFPKQEEPFRAAIAFYPYCAGQLEDSNAPLLILAGELDTWCPALLCQTKMPSGKSTHEVVLKIYPGAHHAFDWEGVDLVRLQRHRLLYNPEALADSINQVREFLAKHLK